MLDRRSAWPYSHRKWPKRVGHRRHRLCHRLMSQRIKLATNKQSVFADPLTSDHNIIIMTLPAAELCHRRPGSAANRLHVAAAYWLSIDGTDRRTDAPLHRRSQLEAGSVNDRPTSVVHCVAYFVAPGRLISDCCWCRVVNEDAGVLWRRDVHSDVWQPAGRCHAVGQVRHYLITPHRSSLMRRWKDSYPTLCPPIP